MTPEELAARLAPVRLPEDFAAFGWQDALAMLSLGLLAGLALAWIVRRYATEHETEAQALRREIGALSRGRPEARAVGLARLLRGVAPETAMPDAAALYDPAQTVDPEMLERAILEAARKARG
jgi:hypothetical protein